MKFAGYGSASDRFQTTRLKSCDTFLIVDTMVVIRLYFLEVHRGTQHP